MLKQVQDDFRAKNYSIDLIHQTKNSYGVHFESANGLLFSYEIGDTKDIVIKRAPVEYLVTFPFATVSYMDLVLTYSGEIATSIWMETGDKLWVPESGIQEMEKLMTGFFDEYQATVQRLLRDANYPIDLSIILSSLFTLRNPIQTLVVFGDNLGLAKNPFKKDLVFRSRINNRAFIEALIRIHATHPTLELLSLELGEILKKETKVSISSA